MSSCRVSDDRSRGHEGQVSGCESDRDDVEERGCESHVNPRRRSGYRGALSRLFQQCDAAVSATLNESANCMMNTRTRSPSQIRFPRWREVREAPAWVSS